jgi:hypothetical protein
MSSDSFKFAIDLDERLPQLILREALNILLHHDMALHLVAGRK